jgi:hypothetical protein
MAAKCAILSHENSLKNRLFPLRIYCHLWANMRICEPMPIEDSTETEIELTYCDRCERDFNADNESAYEVNTYVRGSYSLTLQTWCEACVHSYAFSCDDCDEYFARDYSGGTNSSGSLVCQSCAESYFSCDNCGDVYHNDDYAEDGLCRSCYRDNNDGLCDDGEKPCLKPRGKGKHFLGVELEVEVRDGGNKGTQADAILKQLRGHAICKGDGSLDYGIEICTSPATLDFHREEIWPGFFSHRHPNLACQSNCGLHVHASRKPLTELTIAKIVCFVNAARNADFIGCIAGRSNNSYCKIKHKKITTAAQRNGDRYEAVNLQPVNTIEFRIFRATTLKPKFYKALEFCDALIQFCMPAARSVRDCTNRAKFCAFVREHKRTWPHLHAFIEASWYGRDNEAAKAFGFLKRSADNNTIPTRDNDDD